MREKKVLISSGMDLLRSDKDDYPISLSHIYISYIYE